VINFYVLFLWNMNTVHSSTMSDVYLYLKIAIGNW
jgi:hypothetical protein